MTPSPTPTVRPSFYIAGVNRKASLELRPGDVPPPIPPMPPATRRR